MLQCPPQAVGRDLPVFIHHSQRAELLFLDVLISSKWEGFRPRFNAIPLGAGNGL